jgi:hypothetical protein
MIVGKRPDETSGFLLAVEALVGAHGGLDMPSNVSKGRVKELVNHTADPEQVIDLRLPQG